MALYVGNTNNIVNWDEIIKNLDSGVIRSPSAIWKDKSSFDNSPVAKEYLNILQTWKDAGYDIEKVYWTDYYPFNNYTPKVDTAVCKFLDISLRRSWISRVDPGRVAPWHYDVEDRISDWQKSGEVVRYTIFIDKPKWGCVFVLEKTPFYNINQGEVYEWNSWNQYHGAASCGGEEQYLYHIIGVKNG